MFDGAPAITTTYLYDDVDRLAARTVLGSTSPDDNGTTYYA
ncbi:MAG TPA: hypothetical protein VIS06_07025 [Mycobacteriales bacterium]